MFFIFLMIWRRVILLFTAMFLTKLAWLQISIFVWVAFWSMFYVGHVMPNLEYKYNIVDIINEEFVLVCAYLSMTLIGLSTTIEISYAIGDMMRYVLQLMLLFNMLFILMNILGNLKLRLKKWHRQLQIRLRKKHKQLLFKVRKKKRLAIAN